MKNPEVSVIIPIYNREKKLGICLKSVLNQTYKDYEIIVVDNNSTDNTKQVIKEFQKKNKKIKYLFETKKGIGAARNTGEKNAKGKIILMTDSDCIVPKNWIKEMIKPMIEENYDAVQGFDENAAKDFWNKHYQLESNKKLENRKNQIIGYIDTKNFAIKTASLKKIGFTSRKEAHGNDTALSIKIVKNNFKIKFVEDVKVKHFHPDSLSKVIETCIHRAKWTAIITKDNKDFLTKTDFLKRTAQTPKTFLEFFPGLIGAIKKGKRFFYYNLTTGISWRIGLICGSIKKSSAKIKTIKYSDFKKLRKEDSEYYSLNRWKYFKRVIKLIKKIKPKSVLELGAYKLPIVKNSEVMDIKKMRCTNIIYDATKTPWPIKDKQYDLFIALQVWEHLREKQQQAFKEVMRISRSAILSFPLNWKLPKDINYFKNKDKNKQFIKKHEGITGKKISEWTLNVKPIKKIKVRDLFGERLIYLYKF